MMSKILLNLTLVAPALLGLAISTSASASDLEQIQRYAREGTGSNPINQVTSVSQLGDVQPTDWAFQALQSLVERYGVIAGYPDGRFRGNRALTRYEFAAGLNAALDRVNELIAAGTTDLVTKEDLATLQKLQEEFSAELATLRGRVDALEARTATLESQQFSTTTKLQGEVIFGISDVFSGDNEVNNAVFHNRVRLNLNSSFFGRDRLTMRLQSGNVARFAAPGPNGTFSANSNEARLGYEFNNSGAFELGRMLYTLPLSRNLRVTLAANDVGYDDIIDTVNPLDSSGNGAISRFGQRNPIYRTGGGAGAAVQVGLSDNIKLDLGYLGGEASNPTAGNGLFNGDYAALAQVTFTPSSALKVALTYVNSFNDSGIGWGLGSSNTTTSVAVSGNSYGIEANYRLSPGVQIGGWGGYTSIQRLTAAGGTRDVWNFAVTLAFPDLGKKGSLGGIVFGMQPRVTGSNGWALAGGATTDRDTGFHVEGFYRYRLSDNIAVTPGIIWLTAPNHDARNSGIVVGTIRTTFSF
ncbi:MAG: iron uptake porin [Leptolyngbyaceae bacterium]|nr:iron uptake porin [Leptolyngbyaceae bacterium]